MRHLPAATLALLLVSACAPDKPNEGASATEAIDLWGRYVSLSCQKARTCCAQEQFDIAGLASCEEDLPRAFNLNMLVRSIDEGSIAFDKALFTRCLGQLEKQVDECTQPAIMEECAETMRGTLVAGAACESVAQCAAPHGAAVCQRVEPKDAPDPDKILGVCHSEVRGKLGDACFDTCSGKRCLSTHTVEKPGAPSAYCFHEDGLYCDSLTARCTAMQTPGGKCAFSDACPNGYFCNAADVCQANLTRGQRCDDETECADGLACGKDDTCSSFTPASEDFCSGDLD